MQYIIEIICRGMRLEHFPTSQLVRCAYALWQKLLEAAAQSCASCRIMCALPCRSH